MFNMKQWYVNNSFHYIVFTNKSEPSMHKTIWLTTEGQWVSSKGLKPDEVRIAFRNKSMPFPITEREKALEPLLSK